jgi:hypothetical protein
MIFRGAVIAILAYYFSKDYVIGSGVLALSDPSR